jgi:hypothetical protein
MVNSFYILEPWCFQRANPGPGLEGFFHGVICAKEKAETLILSVLTKCSETTVPLTSVTHLKAREQAGKPALCSTPCTEEHWPTHSSLTGLAPGNTTYLITVTIFKNYVQFS